MPAENRSLILFILLAGSLSSNLEAKTGAESS
jgi:hypothetical protein